MPDAEEIARAAALISKELRLDAVVQATIEQAAELFHLHTVSLYLLDGELLRLVQGSGLASTSPIQTIPVDAPYLVAKAARTGTLQLVRHPREIDDTLAGTRSYVEGSRFGGLLALPLLAFGKLVGVLGIAQPEGRLLDEHSLGQLQSLALVCAVSLSNAQSFGRETRLRAQLEAIRATALKMSSGSSLTGMLQTAVDDARKLVGARHAGIGLSHPPEGHAAWVLGGPGLRLPRTPPGALLQTIHRAELEQDTAWQELREALGPIRNFLGVPLASGDRAVGLLFVADKCDADDFTPDDLHALELAAPHAAISITRAQTELQLRRERQDLARAQRIAHLATWTWDLQTEEIRWSNEMSRILRLPSSNRAWTFEESTRFIHPEDRLRVSGIIARALESHASHFEYDCRIVRPDGSIRFTHTDAQILSDAGHQPIEIVGAVLDTTEQVQTERALRASEENFRLILEQAPIGLAIVGLDGRFSRVNRALCDIVGYEPDELVKLRFQDITHPDDLAIDLGYLQDLLTGRTSRYRLPKRYIRKDGSLVDIVLHASLVRDASGQPLHFIAQIEDVGEEKRAQEALRRSEAQFRELVERSPDCIFVHRDGKFVFANPAFARLVGYENPAELVGRSLFDTVHPDDRASVASRVQMVLRSKVATPPRLYRMLRRDGTVVELEAVGMAARYDGQPSVLVVARDVSERRQAERERERLLQELGAEQRWLESVIERMPVGIILLQVEGGPRLRANRSAEKLFGRKFDRTRLQEQYVGQVCDREGHPFALENMPVTRALRGQMTVGEEFSIRQPDGSLRPARGSMTPIRNEAGVIVGAVVVFEDITPLRETERMREEWMSVVAHDLRQPITIIQTYVALLTRTVKDPASQTKLLHIQNSTKRLERMINDLLDMSRLEAKRLRLRPEKLLLSPALRLAAERVAATSQGHPIETEIAPDLPPVMADAGRLDQILDNLLSNAVKYSYPGTKIQLGARRGDAGALIWVRNEGKGIPPEQIPNLFTRFHRVGGEAETSIPGIGLGLYITRGLVEAQGGSICADSVPGETTFWFSLPAAAELPVSHAQRESGPSPSL